MIMRGKPANSQCHYNGTAKNPAPFGLFVATRLATVTTFIENFNC